MPWFSYVSILGHPTRGMHGPKAIKDCHLRFHLIKQVLRQPQVARQYIAWFLRTYICICVRGCDVASDARTRNSGLECA